MAVGQPPLKSSNLYDSATMSAQQTAPQTPEPLPRRSIDSVLFDLGGVLIDWSPRYLFSRHFSNDEPGLDHFLTHVCPSEWNVTMDAGKPAAVGLAERVAEHPQHESMIRRWFDEWPAMMKGPVEGVPEILASLKRAGLRTCALTNWSADTFHHAQNRFEFLQSFDDIVVSGRIGMIKPDPAIFHYTIEQCKLDPARTLFIDDSAKNIATAEMIGFRVHHFTGVAKLRQHVALLLGDPA